MLQIALALALPLHFAPQEEAEPSIEEELAALIEKTNALETFHLVYDLEIVREGKTENATFELVYRAPDLGRVRTSNGDVEADVWVVEDKMFMKTEGSWKSGALPAFPFRQALDDFFPVETPLGPGVFFLLTLRNEESRRPTFSLSLGALASGRSWVLGWLHDLQHRSDVTRPASSLDWQDDGLRCRVSRRSGFLEEADVESETGRLTVRLRDAQVDVPLEDELLTLPSDALSAPEKSEIGRAFDPGRSASRRDAYGRVADWLESSEHEWNELASNHWRTVMEALHRREITAGHSEWLAGVKEQIAQKVEGARTQLESDDSAETRAEVERRVAELRASLAENLDRGQERYLDTIQSIETHGKEPSAAMLEVETEVVHSLWDELMREPVLEEFDQEFGELLRR